MINITNHASIGITENRSITINPDREQDMQSLADCLSICSQSENLAREIARIDSGVKGRYVSRRPISECLSGLRRRPRQLVTSATRESLGGSQICRYICVSTDGDIQSSHTYKNGRVQSIREQRVLENGKAEVFSLNRNQNGSITMDFEINDAPRFPIARG